MTLEYSPSNRAVCRMCDSYIVLGEPRMRTKFKFVHKYGTTHYIGRRRLHFYCCKCAKLIITGYQDNGFLQLNYSLKDFNAMCKKASKILILKELGKNEP